MMSSNRRIMGNSRTTPTEILDVTFKSISSSRDEAGAIASTSEDRSSADFIDTCWCLTICSATCSAALSVRDTDLLLLDLDGFGPSKLRDELGAATFISWSAWGTKSSRTTRTTGILDFLATRASVLQGKEKIQWMKTQRMRGREREKKTRSKDWKLDIEKSKCMTWLTNWSLVR